MKYGLHSLWALVACALLTGCVTREKIREGATVQVSNQIGQPVAGAQVQLYFEESGGVMPKFQAELEPMTLETDAKGSARLTPLYQEVDAMRYVEITQATPIVEIIVEHEDYKTFKSGSRWTRRLDEKTQRLEIIESDFWSSYPKLKVILQESL